MGQPLSTYESLKNLPSMDGLSEAWLNQLILAASTAIKRFCKQELSVQSYVEYYGGTAREDLVINQKPLWCGSTTIAAGSNGVSLPQATINVASTKNFCPGTFGDPDAVPPTIAVQTAQQSGLPAYAAVTYTGTTATSFTGCSGGTGVMSSATASNAVGAPVIFVDANGYSGQNPTGFQPGTIWSPGANFMVNLDRGGVRSNRGTIKCVNLAGMWWPGTYPTVGGPTSKLFAKKLASWPWGQGNIKVCYTGGYYPVPDDLQYACNMVVAYMVRNQPSGQALSSESLGAYSYSVVSGSKDNEQLGDVYRCLQFYREFAM